ncbi:hypothetical protein Tsubulata_005013 [Turnera subulata]|uniref:Uncharacterized protein n=1 Tax=Turnera subulata TaxID=218843 RepID=A0A9Q0FAW0_9ROSI|nr:hypothetical protein Tsubulata_005013 [Turnera subulata]
MGEIEHINTVHKHHQEAAQEEALSLSELPLGDDGDNTKNYMETANTTTTATPTRRSSSEPPEFFEFLSDNSSDMISAEDIIWCGKLIPFRELPSSPPIQNPTENHKRHVSSIRRRCESLSELQSSLVARSNSAKARGLMRNSRSLDYRKLERLSSYKKLSPESDMERNPSVRSTAEKGGDNCVVLRRAGSTTKPRWFQLMFGVVKPPTGMELRDIKSRQVRLNPAVTMFPPPADGSGKKVPANGSLDKGPCGLLLRVLSCKDPASVAVTTSLCMPQV